MIRRLVATLSGLAAGSPTLNAAGEFDAAIATNHVGLELFRQLGAAAPRENLVLSPYSIESALALVYAGAAGTTRDEMSRTLQLAAENAAVQVGFAKLRQQLNQVAQSSRAAAERESKYGGTIAPMEWQAANRIFGQQGYAFRESFLTLMKDGFDAPLEALDFHGAAEHARTTINDWVEGQTQKKIRDLIPRGGLGADARLVLVNALYLKAPWATPFSTAATLPEPFHFSDGETHKVPTMHRTDYLGYEKSDGVTVVALDYFGGELQCLILLPDAGRDLPDVVAALTPQHFAHWATLKSELAKGKIALSLPKFTVKGTTVPLGSALRSLGIKSAFDEPAGSANFDPIAPRKPNDYLLVSEVFHQTFVALDEEGTEAAAATAVAMRAGSAMMKETKPIEVRVDRPFLFAIQHRASGTCLFLGRISDPR